MGEKAPGILLGLDPLSGFRIRWNLQPGQLSERDVPRR